MPHILRLFALVFTLLAIATAADVAEQHYKLGQAAERRGAQLEAYARYVQAQAADPSKRKYVRASMRLRAATAQAIAMQSSSALDAVAETESVEPLDQGDDDLTGSLREALGPTEIEPEKKIASFRFEGTIQEAYGRVLKEYGISVLFDEGFTGGGQTRFHLDDVRFDDALLTLNEIAKAFVIPLTAKLVLIAEDTPGKRTELEPVVSIDIPIPEAASPQDANEVVQAIQQTLEIRRMFVVPSRNVVTIRDSPAKARMARLLFDRLLVAQPEVVIEIDIISYNDSRDSELGVDLPTLFPVTNYSTVLNAVPPARSEGPEAIIGGGKSLFGVGVADSRIVANLTAGTGRTIQRMSVRASHGTEAQMRVGERFPIITASFQPGSGIEPSGDNALFQLPPPTISYEDLGLSINATPMIHEAGEVTLQLQAEFNLLSGAGANGIPILVSRTIETQVRLRAGESAIIAGMAIDEQRLGKSSPFGLIGIPVVSNLLGRKTNQTNSTDLLIVVRPRIVRLPAADMVKELSIRFGSEERPLSSL